MTDPIPRCSVAADPILPHEATVTCHSCGAVAHSVCWQQVSMCASCSTPTRGASAAPAISVVPEKCPSCGKNLPASGLDRCTWCRHPLTREAGERAARDPAPPRCPIEVRVASSYLRLAAVTYWIGGVVALGYFVFWTTANAAILKYSDGIAVGLALGAALGVYVRRVGAALAEGESAARAKATVIFVVHMLTCWVPLVLVGLAGVMALGSSRSRRFFAGRRAAMLRREELGEDVRPKWRRHGIDEDRA